MRASVSRLQFHPSGKQMKQTQEEGGTLETQNAGGHNPGLHRDLSTQLHLMSRVRQNASSSFRWADLRTGAGCVGEDRTP